MKKFDDISDVTQKLLQRGFVFESEEAGLLPLRIQRSIGKNQFVDILPTLKKIYSSAVQGDSKSVASLISDLTSLLVAADLGIAREFLIEMEVRTELPKVMRQLNKDLKKAAKSENMEIDPK